MHVVRKQDSEWVRWVGPKLVDKEVTTATQVYQDGRTEEVTVPPYTVQQNVNGSQVETYYNAGQWSEAEVVAVGGRLAVPFVVPDGAQTVGDGAYVEIDGVLQQVFDIEAIPEPPPPPTATEKFDAFLASIDLTRAEFLAQLT